MDNNLFMIPNGDEQMWISFFHEVKEKITAKRGNDKKERKKMIGIYDCAKRSGNTTAQKDREIRLRKKIGKYDYAKRSGNTTTQKDQEIRLRKKIGKYHGTK
ncbi:hypothetical protein POVCU2_0045010 [Plasmodium ovale curtisi]|uniref:Uncharacterized protein n=1 Tax=Plasmodium ovale curtisi TaxID=864141 RepID=A0A1A8W4M1_PLAOA|nr:hypothetical protein POVCU2_0045010 [Plasmodium ovale curtisi]